MLPSSQRIECSFGTFALQRNISSSSSSSSAPKQNQPRLCIAYRILHPSLLKRNTAAPILVIHGGPSLPSEYLTPLANHIQNRSTIFYDQLGCGWSSIPRQKEWYGVTQMSHDLEELLQHLREVWKVQSFHLLGHSLGGAIGYEYLKNQIANNLNERRNVPQCLSFILSNASTNLALSSREQKRLFQEFQLQQQFQTSMPSSNNQQTQKKRLSVKEEFFHTHICRTRSKPTELESALSRRGMEWSANDYIATPLPPPTIAPVSLSADSNTNYTTEALSSATASNLVNRFPPVLIIRGQHDFVTETCTRGWFEMFADGVQEEVILDDCAHYPHFESPERYSHQIEKFCSIAESNCVNE